MAGGGFDFSDFEKFAEQLEKAGQKVKPQMLKLTKEAGARLYSEAIRNTKRYVKRGTGTLERSWGIGGVYHNVPSKQYRTTVWNTASDGGTKYAIYVEYGHRTKKRKDGSRGWVEGRYMLTRAKRDLEKQLPKMAERIVINEIFKE